MPGILFLLDIINVLNNQKNLNEFKHLIDYQLILLNAFLRDWKSRKKTDHAGVEDNQLISTYSGGFAPGFASPSSAE